MSDKSTIATFVFLVTAALLLNFVVVAALVWVVVVVLRAMGVLT